MSARWLACIGFVAVAAWTPRAHAFDLFRSADGSVERGNRRMGEQDWAGAREAYEEALRRLPSEAGVHLDRGLALLAAGELDEARSAFLAATEPPASPEVRADAYYDLGLAFFRGGEAAAGVAQQPPGGTTPPGAANTGGGPGDTPATPDHREAQRQFREAADAFRRSLRIRPGNRDAAWNLELALRRLHEEEEAQRQQDQQQQDQQQDQQQQDQQQQDQQQQDQRGQALPEPSRRLLDALQDHEQSLQQYRAQQRRYGRQAPAQDW